MLRELTTSEIKELASRPKVRKLAVENFLMTVHHNSNEQTALYNLELDSKLHRWNQATVKAICDEIRLASKKIV